MAVVSLVRVESADQEAHDRLQAAVEARIRASGEPPEGLMVHIAHGDGDGFSMAIVWRSEQVFHRFWSTILVPAIEETQVTVTEPVLQPVWSLARY